MVDDNPADIDLTSEVLAQSEQHFHVNAVNDGVEAISFLRRQGKYAKAPVPDLVVLDLNLPRKDGCEVLSNIKADPALAKIPVVIFTTSQASSDITRSYKLGANCYLQKAGKSSGIRRGGPIHGGILAGLRQPAAEGETMKRSIDPRSADRRQSGRCGSGAPAAGGKQVGGRRELRQPFVRRA